MPHMLPVAAFQICDPIPVLILMEADDPPIHRVRVLADRLARRQPDKQGLGLSDCKLVSGKFSHVSCAAIGTSGMHPFTVTKIELWTLDIPLTDPFAVAAGTRPAAENAIVRMTLANGAQGYGEIAPFPEIGGEDRAACLAMAHDLGKTLLGRPVTEHARLARELRAMTPAHPAARCGLETALLDAFCRGAGIPMWALWGGADLRSRETDITIPITDVTRTVALVTEWHARGFRLFKMKVGRDVDHDVRRLEAVHQRMPDIAFIGDANQGFTYEHCLAFVKGVTRFGGRLILIEQPVAREDLASMAALRRATGIPVAADEAVRSISDAAMVIRQGAADVINIKITKMGILEAREIASYALASGLKLMIGGMVETRVAMGCSFALVLGRGGFELLDLDTPLLMTTDPVTGGYRYAGPLLQPWQGPGLDVSLPPPKDAIVIT
jgi:o-succinylbenzoate synthase